MEVVVASGKGGTGKTFFSSNLAVYLRDRGGCVAADADVEAPDFLLALGGARRVLWREEFRGVRRPVVDYSACVKCWACVDACQFNAIRRGPEGPVVDYDRCEGLGTCAFVCPAGAIGFAEERAGEIYAAETEHGVTVVTGDLELGGGASGRLVYELKERARRLSSGAARYVVVDAAPGIGCPVVSSVAGADLLVVVVEPTPQSAKGAARLLEVAGALRVKAVAVVNKYDLNPSYAARLEGELGVDVAGRIPYDEAVARSYAEMKPLIVAYPSSKAARALLDVFSSLGV
ncbi:nucleotide-binding protein [Thermofilum pendens]|uniref:Cobyrinic acid a,c-diamide synthase n=1 Tax=Thermofilum pendens (strain DSM 2475 / Hrk 5) TaxID=368408 RepID=A1RYW6_THEPD|nr:ATP-binding protein [Thermofilum pendens]ABL78396.1 Cobyrinic acid a,c-diamide synthase [Thermofilum pendens Hrk 5]